jgi:hypothetical protein
MYCQLSLKQIFMTQTYGTNQGEQEVVLESITIEETCAEEHQKITTDD